MWLGVGVLALPLGAWAQASGESSEMGPGINAQAGGVDAMAARSPLWQAVDAMHRQRDGAAAQDRRLSAEERSSCASRSVVHRYGWTAKRSCATRTSASAEAAAAFAA